MIIAFAQSGEYGHGLTISFLFPISFLQEYAILDMEHEKTNVLQYL